MRTIRVLAAVIAALVVSVPSALASRAELRILTPTASLLGQDAVLVGSARSYFDDKAVAHALVANTALGQLVAGGLLGELDTVFTYNQQYNAALITGIGGIKPTGNASWSLFVNDVLAPVGAESTVLKQGDKVTWLLDPDYNLPGPEFLDLKLVKRTTKTLTLSVVRAGIRPVAAVGARVKVNGHTYKVSKQGKVTVKVVGPWFAQATLSGTVASQRLFGDR